MAPSLLHTLWSRMRGTATASRPAVTDPWLDTTLPTPTPTPGATATRPSPPAGGLTPTMAQQRAQQQRALSAALDATVAFGHLPENERDAAPAPPA